MFQVLARLATIVKDGMTAELTVMAANIRRLRSGATFAELLAGVRQRGQKPEN